ncbi:MAG: hypothetical protein GXN94_03505 [Aquificae bacterium]|nr:hypothetical protein [Aquificota bacterium]
MELKVENPQDIMPIMDRYKLPDGVPLYKSLKGFTVLHLFFTGEPRNLLFILAYKNGNPHTFRIVRYFKNVADVGIDAEFQTDDLKEAVRKTFIVLSKHII